MVEDQIKKDLEVIKKDERVLIITNPSRDVSMISEALFICF